MQKLGAQRVVIKGNGPAVARYRLPVTHRTWWFSIPKTARFWQRSPLEWIRMAPCSIPAPCKHSGRLSRWHADCGEGRAPPHSFSSKPCKRSPLSTANGEPTTRQITRALTKAQRPERPRATRDAATSYGATGYGATSVFSPACAHCSSCALVPPLAPMAPITLPSIMIGNPPCTAVT